MTRKREITRYPAEIIVEYPEDNEVAAKVSMVDSGGATVKIDLVTNAREWREISDHVLAALLEMRLDGDVTA